MHICLNCSTYNKHKAFTLNDENVHVCSLVLSCSSLCSVALACQAPLSTGFSKQEYWSGLPCPPPGGLPDQGIEPVSLMPPARAGVLHHQRPGKPHGPCCPPSAGPRSSPCLAGSSMRAEVSPALFRAEDTGIQQALNRCLKEHTDRSSNKETK